MTTSGVDTGLARTKLETELYEPDVEQEDTSSEITEPYDPSEIRIQRDSPTVELLMKRIKHGELILTPSFQRNLGLWNDVTQSRLVESLLMRIPLPAFYFDATDRDRWLVVDGLQRLTALARFLLDDENLAHFGVTRLELRDLEFLVDLNGKTFSNLHRRYQRQIEETQLTTFLIGEGTPPEVKFNVFKRINTGGLPLAPQEIRHALNQGRPADFLKELAEKDSFIKATVRGISGKRMADRECVLRFLAFMMVPPERYPSKGDFDYFLSERMAELGKMEESSLEEYARRFDQSMLVARKVFDNDAFRKRYDPAAARNPISKALFEVWAVNLAHLSGEEVATLVKRRTRVREGFIELCRDRDFDRAISGGTGDVKKVKLRFEAVRSLVEGVLE